MLWWVLACRCCSWVGCGKPEKPPRGGNALACWRLPTIDSGMHISCKGSLKHQESLKLGFAIHRGVCSRCGRAGNLRRRRRSTLAPLDEAYASCIFSTVRLLRQSPKDSAFKKMSWCPLLLLACLCLHARWCLPAAPAVPVVELGAVS